MMLKSLLGLFSDFHALLLSKMQFTFLLPLSFSCPFVTSRNFLHDPSAERTVVSDVFPTGSQAVPLPSLPVVASVSHHGFLGGVCTTLKHTSSVFSWRHTQARGEPLSSLVGNREAFAAFSGYRKDTNMKNMLLICFLAILLNSILESQKKNPSQQPHTAPPPELR